MKLSKNTNCKSSSPYSIFLFKRKKIQKDLSDFYIENLTWKIIIFFKPGDSLAILFIKIDSVNYKMFRNSRFDDNVHFQLKCLTIFFDFWQNKTQVPSKIWQRNGYGKTYRRIKHHYLFLTSDISIAVLWKV